MMNLAIANYYLLDVMTANERPFSLAEALLRLKMRPRAKSAQKAEAAGISTRIIIISHQRDFRIIREVKLKLATYRKRQWQSNIS
jgi:hypothetical protein